MYIIEIIFVLRILNGLDMILDSNPKRSPRVLDLVKSNLIHHQVE